jgi:hypothetical protein
VGYASGDDSWPVAIRIPEGCGGTVSTGPHPRSLHLNNFHKFGILICLFCKGGNGQESFLIIFFRISFYLIDNENEKGRNRIRSVKSVLLKRINPNKNVSVSIGKQ